MSLGWYGRAAVAVVLTVTSLGCFKGFEAVKASEFTFSSLFPGGSADEKTVNEDTELRFKLAPTATARISFKLLNSPQFGKIISFDASTGEVAYQPNADIHSVTDSIQFQMIVDDAEAETSDTFEYHIRILPVNDLPVTKNPAAVSLNEDAAMMFDLTADDVDGDALTLAVVAQPANGTVLYDIAAKRFLYTPKPNFNGTDTFTFKAVDGQGESNVSTMTIQVAAVNDLPVTVNPALTTLVEDGNAQVAPIGTDVDGDALTFEAVMAPARGTLVYDAVAKRFTYTPRANLNGADSFTYRARDAAGVSNVATAMIMVTPVNDAPTLAAQTFDAGSGRVLSATVLASDVDGTALTLTVQTNVLHGVLNFNGLTFTYQSVAGFFGEDSFTVTVSDGQLTTAAVRMVINVTEIVDEQTVVRNLVANCPANAQFNTCIFWKNPVGQNGAPFATPVVPATNLAPIQLQAVNIMPAWYDTSGFLKNTSFDLFLDIAANAAGRVTTAANNFKFVYANDPNRRVTQVVTFYWLMTQVKFMKQRLGNFFAEAKGTKVFASNPAVPNNAYFDSDANEVQIGRDSVTGADIGLNPEVAMHEMGHANVFHGSNGNIYNYGANGTDGNDFYCVSPVDGNVCCGDKTGCSWAINEGLADHHAALLFFDDPALGQTWVNRVDGLRSCGVDRNAIRNTALTADTAFTACGVNSAQPAFNGEVHVTGSLYASIWYELKKAERGGANAVDIDKLFNEHLKVITGADTFVTIYAKIRAIDTALFGGKFGAKVQAEFQRRLII